MLNFFIKKLLFLIFFTVYLSHSKNDDCTTWFLKLAPRSDFNDIYINNFNYSVSHKSGALVEGRLSREGVLTFSIRSKDKLGNRLWDKFNAKDAVRKMLKHFDGKIKAIKTEWVEKIDSKDLDNPFSMTTNLDQLNSYIKSGGTLEEGIQKTWSGQLLQECGYKFSQVNRAQIHPDHLDRLFWVEAIFIKP